MIISRALFLLLLGAGLLRGCVKRIERTVIPREEATSDRLRELVMSAVDALPDVQAPVPILELEMRIEALETHLVRRADLLVVERPEGGRVFRDREGSFWGVLGLQAPTSCQGVAGSCVGDEDDARAVAIDALGRIVVGGQEEGTIHGIELTRHIPK